MRLRSFAVAFIAILLLFGAGTEKASAQWAVAVTGAPTIEAGQAMSFTQNLVHYGQVVGNWATTINQGISQINQFADYLLLFGDPSNIVNLVGLNSVMGSDSALGGVIGNVFQLGGTAMNSFDSVQQLASKGMQLYGIGQSLTQGDVLPALYSMGLSDVANAAGIAQTLELNSNLLGQARSLTSYSEGAWTGVSSAMRQLRTARTDAEVAKAQGNVAAQVAVAQRPIQQQMADQLVLQNQFAAEEARRELRRIKIAEMVASWDAAALGEKPRTSSESSYNELLKTPQ